MIGVPVCNTNQLREFRNLFVQFILKNVHDYKVIECCDVFTNIFVLFFLSPAVHCLRPEQYIRTYCNLN
jgi:hypothetical protein